MRHRKKRSPHQAGKGRLKVQRTLVLGALCLSLFLFGPHYQTLNRISITPGPVQAQNADAQGSSASDGAADDTPSEQDIADFASEYDKDGDGEVDEPDDEEAEEASEPDEADEADQEDDGDDGDDRDDGDDGDDRDDLDRENEDDEDDDGEEEDDSSDVAHSGKNRDDIDGEASPEFRLSGYDRYHREGTLRRLGAREEMTPLIAREEKLLLEN
jgi:hypothetical protein